jgi:hypothetical protein
MLTYKFECGLCLKIEQAKGSTIKSLITEWKIFNDQPRTLPPGVRIMVCQGCGSLGIKLINSENAKA